MPSQRYRSVIVLVGCGCPFILRSIYFIGYIRSVFKVLEKLKPLIFHENIYLLNPLQEPGKGLTHPVKRSPTGRKEILSV